MKREEFRKGMRVRYIGRGGGPREDGVVNSVGTSFVFVKFDKDRRDDGDDSCVQAKACYAEDLQRLCSQD